MGDVMSHTAQRTAKKSAQESFAVVEEVSCRGPKGVAPEKGMPPPSSRSRRLFLPYLVEQLSPSSPLRKGAAGVRPLSG